MKYTREERRKFRKRWRVAARRAPQHIRDTLRMGHYPSRDEMLARKNLVGIV